MKRFRVTLRETVYYTVIVEGEDEGAAWASAPEVWAQSSDPTEDFEGKWYGVKAEDIEEIEDEHE